MYWFCYKQFKPLTRVPQSTKLSIRVAPHSIIIVGRQHLRQRTLPYVRSAYIPKRNLTSWLNLSGEYTKWATLHNSRDSLQSQPHNSRYTFSIDRAFKIHSKTHIYTWIIYATSRPALAMLTHNNQRIFVYFDLSIELRCEVHTFCRTCVSSRYILALMGVLPARLYCIRVVVIEHNLVFGINMRGFSGFYCYILLRCDVHEYDGNRKHSQAIYTSPTKVKKKHPKLIYELLNNYLRFTHFEYGYPYTIYVHIYRITPIFTI